MYQNTDTYMLHRTLISCVYTSEHVQVYIHKVETRHLFPIFQRLYALYLLQQILTWQNKIVFHLTFLLPSD